MELLERDRFVADLTSLMHRVEAGNGQTVLISGEAGIGKTTLVRQFIAEHRNVSRVLWGGCEALFTPRPLGPLHDIARQAQGNLSKLLNDEASRATIFSAFLDELQRCTPLAITVIEDVHWADEATLDVIKFLGRRIHLLSTLLIITYRDDELGAQHPLRFVLGDLPGTAVTRLRLPPLSEAAVTTLAQRARRPAKGLYAATGGNPFFVTEVLASDDSLDHGVPATIRDTVLARAARLSSSARSVLELASVVPARVERWLLDAIFPSELPSDSALIDECVESGMLRFDNTDLTFRHELARLAIEDSLSPARRRHLHALVLAALINPNSLGTQDIALSRLVHHARHSGDREAVLRFAPSAGKQAASLGAHRESASHYATALHYGDHLAPEERAGLLEGYAYECYLTDEVEEALKARLTALDIWRELTQQEKVGHNLRWLSRLSWFMGNKADADSYAIQSVAVLEKLPPGCELAMTYSNCAQLYMLADETAKAVDWGRRALALAEQLGDNEILAHALNNIGAAMMQTGNNIGQAHLEKSLQISLAQGFEEHAARAYSNLSSICVKAHRYSEAVRYLNDGIHYCIERDLDAWRLYMSAWRARSHLEQGNWQEAADDAHSVLGKPHVSMIAKIPALTALAHVRVRRGDPDAMTLLDEALALAMPTGELQRIVPVVAARAEAAWLKCDLEQCVAEARWGFEMALTAKNLPELGELSFWMWRGGGLIEPPAGIEAPYALHICGNWQAAAAAWEKLGCPYERAMALADGDEVDQRTALEIFVQLGAAPAAEIVRQKLRLQGVRGIPRGPRPTTRENPGGLTARQLEVLVLIAEGLQNAEIANRLSTSTKTIDHHVSAVLAKLDARSRAEAVILANQLGILPAKDREARESK
jgi:predicted ATPase/DNA-binding CsgD family transcriptional regulator